LRCSPVIAAVLALATTGLVPVAAQEATPTSPPAERQLTAIVVSAIGGPIGVPGSDSRQHIEYDLVITNVFNGPVKMSTIEVLTLDGDSLLSVAGNDLVVATQPLLGLTPLEEIPASGTAVVIIDVAVPLDQVPDRLTHRITYTLPSNAPWAGQIESLTVDGPELVVDNRAPVVIAPPVHGPGWLNAFSCCDASSVHRGGRAAADGARIVKSETFAIDWILLQDNRFFEGDGAQRAVVCLWCRSHRRRPRHGRLRS
jgi:hypothetical protein